MRVYVIGASSYHPSSLNKSFSTHPAIEISFVFVQNSVVYDCREHPILNGIERGIRICDTCNVPVPNNKKKTQAIEKLNLSFDITRHVTRAKAAYAQVGPNDIKCTVLPCDCYRARNTALRASGKHSLEGANFRAMFISGPIFQPNISSCHQTLDGARSLPRSLGILVYKRLSEV